MTKTGDGKIQIMELFGPTVQGEGIMTGTLTHFLRTGGCALRCSWCDSLFAVLPDQILKYRRLMTTDEILKEIGLLPQAPYITFTGGDPAIQPRLGDLIPALNMEGMRVAIETQGMFFPDWLERCDVLTFSPKGPSSGNVVDPKKLADYCVSLGKKRPQRVCIKIVCFDEQDFLYAMAVYRLIPAAYYDAFYFTAGTPLLEPPEGEPSDADKEAIATGRLMMVIQNQQAVAKEMLKAENCSTFNEKVHLGCQQHVLLWPHKDKGV